MWALKRKGFFVKNQEEGGEKLGQSRNVMRNILYNKLMAYATKSSGRVEAPVQREGVRRKRHNNTWTLNLL